MAVSVSPALQSHGSSVHVVARVVPQPDNSKSATPVVMRNMLFLHSWIFPRTHKRSKNCSVRRVIFPNSQTCFHTRQKIRPHNANLFAIPIILNQPCVLRPIV